MDSITLDPDPNWAKILDPDPNSLYLDPRHCFSQGNSVADPNPHNFFPTGFDSTFPYLKTKIKGQLHNLKKI